MFKKISGSMKFPQWAQEGSRWRTLQIYDAILDGKFYDHLPKAFYDETEPNGETLIPLEQRRPSSQYRLARYVGRWAARKLFAGRHIPKVRAKDNTSLEQKIADLLTNTHIWSTMFEAAYRGSVGSVGITFRHVDGVFGLNVWRALWCSPSFDSFSNLVNLRVHYCTKGWQLALIGIKTEDLARDYWFVRDYGVNTEITYRPVKVEDWNPVEGPKNTSGELIALETINHNLGFVPGVWIMNPCGCTPPDGAALWEDAIPNMIEIDYLLSQSARGSRYNCAPQLVTIGQVMNTEKILRGPATYLAMNAGTKDKDGNTLNAGDAKLLEMDGKGVEAALKIVDTLKKLGLEQIGVVQKDPGELPGPLSGRAMEFLDEDAHDTAQHWRSTYGDGGALALICKMMKVVDKSVDTKNVWLQWPRIYLPTPGDMLSLSEAMQIVAQPQAVVGAVPSGADGSVPVMPPLLDPEIARQYLLANMDLGILDDTYNNGSPRAPGDEPAPSREEGGATIADTLSPFWRILPPVRVRE